MDPTWGVHVSYMQAARTRRGSSHMTMLDSKRKIKTYHLVDCFDNDQHLVITKFFITVNIVELKSQVELVFHLSAACDTKRNDEVLKSIVPESSLSKALKVSSANEEESPKGKNWR